MRKKPLDTIPLLDIMIVVLFIFASIEEDKSPDESPALKEEIEKLRADSAAASSRVVAAELERDELKKAVEAGKTEIQQGIESNRQREILKSLLGEAQVIEIEIEGRPTDDAIVNPCCYRRFALDAKWKSCGEVPTAQDERGRWLDDGAGGLLAELNATGATPTMVIVRQERDAAYNISDDVGQLVRERTPIKKTYGVTVETPVEHCSASPP